MGPALYGNHDPQCAELHEFRDGALIEAKTGMRFSIFSISRHRAARGLDTPCRNDCTAPLRRWRPWNTRRACDHLLLDPVDKELA